MSEFHDPCGAVRSQILTHINEDNMAISSSYENISKFHESRYLIGCKETIVTLPNRVNENYATRSLVARYQGGTRIH